MPVFQEQPRPKQVWFQPTYNHTSHHQHPNSNNPGPYLPPQSRQFQNTRPPRPSAGPPTQRLNQRKCSICESTYHSTQFCPKNWNTLPDTSGRTFCPYHKVTTHSGSECRILQKRPSFCSFHNMSGHSDSECRAQSNRSENLSRARPAQ